MAGSQSSDYRSFRAPSDDQSRLCVPELDQVGSRIEENRQRFSAATFYWMDVPLSTVRTWAREETLIQAAAYTQRYLPQTSNVLSASPESSWDETRTQPPLILSGHQPELFHPGVWFKNFLLSFLAEKISGIGINVLVDHDLARTFAISVPAIGSNRQLHKETLSIDDDRPTWPWEHSRVKDITRWKDFESSVIDRLQSVGISNPLLRDLWPNVIDALEQGRPIGEALSAARHSLEHSNGLRTLELPFSRLASERSFACFVGEILSRIESVHEAYQAARHAYRLHYRIKNHLQPIPALARDGDWFESPFWVYSASNPIRRALWVMRAGTRLQLSDRHHWNVELPCNGKFDQWFSGWKELRRAKVSIRPRALTTTAFLRLAVADGFIHGIGGGKYDQMTDPMIQSLWKFPAPAYLVATATFHLPMSFHGSGTDQSCALTELELLRQVRDWRFSPERLCRDAIPNEMLGALLREKACLVSQIPSGSAKKTWHEDIQRLNSKIRDRLTISEATLMGRLLETRNRQLERSILESREFSLALFASTSIVPALKSMCHSGDTAFSGDHELG